MSRETFEYGEALGHDFGEYVSDDNATCQTNATKTASCRLVRKIGAKTKEFVHLKNERTSSFSIPKIIAKIIAEKFAVILLRKEANCLDKRKKS